MRADDLTGLGIECMELSQGVSYVMGAPSLLSVTGYKVLRSQEPGRYVPCARSRINGSEKLTYLTGGSRSLASCLEGASPRAAQRLLRDLVEAVQTVEDNGFLTPRSVLVERDRVYVDASTGTCSLICLPLTRYPAGGDLEAKQAVFDLCASACAALYGTSSPLAGIERSAEYRAGSLSALRDILSRGSHEAPPSIGAPVSANRSADDTGSGDLRRPAPAAPRATWHLVPSRSDLPELAFVGPSAVIGKSPTKADLVVTGNPAISRAHCRLAAQSDASLTVEDLGSANGTFVNSSRVEAGRPVSLVSGDHLRLANDEFVVMREW